MDAGSRGGGGGPDLQVKVHVDLLCAHLALHVFAEARHIVLGVGSLFRAREKSETHALERSHHAQAEPTAHVLHVGIGGPRIEWSLDDLFRNLDESLILEHPARVLVVR